MRGKFNILGIVLLIAGAVVLIYGIVQFVEFRQSAAGKLAGIGSKVGKAISGKNSMADQEIRSIVMMIGGAIAAGAGVFLTVKR